MRLETYNVAYVGPAESYDDCIARLAAHRGVIFVDTETIGLKGDKSVDLPDWDEEDNLVSVRSKLDARTMIGIGVATSEQEAWYFPLGKSTWPNVPISNPYPLVRLLEDERVTKVFFNAMFDLERIWEHWGIDIKNFHCVAIGSQVQGLWNSLAKNSGFILAEPHVEIDDVLPKNATMLDVKFPTTARKCIEDCKTTAKLFYKYKMDEWAGAEGTIIWEDALGQKFDVTPEIRDCYEVDRRNITLLRKMSHRGIAVNQDVVKRLHDRLRTELQRYDYWFNQWGINPQSNDQLGWYLATERGHYIPLTKSQKHMRADKKMIMTIGDPIGIMALKRRERQKLLGTYVLRALGKERMYTHYRLDLATGRLGSFDINIQNQPDNMREMYEADNGVWTWMDLQQAEMRVWAGQAKDPVMLKAFADGVSPHEVTLKKLFPGVAKKTPQGGSTREYTDSKSFNFALLFDASPQTLSDTTGRPVGVVSKYLDEMFDLYSASKAYIEEQKSHTGMYELTDFGRRCHIPDLDIHVNKDHQMKCRINYPTQGTVADIIKRIMLLLDFMGYDFPIQVHDEIVADGEYTFPEVIRHIHPSIDMPFDVSKPSRIWV